MADAPYDLETLIALNEEKCSKTVNGRCESLRCMRRGDNGNPTCEPLETAAALKELQRVTDIADELADALDEIATGRDREGNKTDFPADIARAALAKYRT